jgi:DNA repair exonuclease SbcCD ATPase subunit
MADGRLKNYVLTRADEDASLPEEARLVVLAALASPDDLAEVLGNGNTSPRLVASLTTPDESTDALTGAYLESITVQGFRGIGPKVTVPLRPRPGLIVIAGRNGSGKSTLAEALELALTGHNSRWKDKTAVWSQNWRNLHAGEPAQIRVGITEEGSGTTTIGVDWPAGDDIDVEQLKAWVQRDGHKQESIDVLGWNAALEMYRPLLSYEELGRILEGRPSEFYDQLHKLLGLEQLTDATGRLDAVIKQLRQPVAELKQARDALKPVLESHDDPRAAAALAQVKKTKPDLEAVRPLITEGTAASVPSSWQHAGQLVTPSSDEVQQKIAALRSAARQRT